MQRRPSDSYSPMYFLASLGAGGASITFFMWLMFWVPHPDSAVPFFEDVLAAFQTGGAALRAAIVVAWAGIAVFLALNLKALVWNLRRFADWRRTEAFAKFSKTNAQSQLMVLPLALAMSVNASFIASLVLVPGLSHRLDAVFPVAMTAFALIAVLAFRTYGHFIGRIKVEGGFNFAANNSFGQILPAFAFGLIGAGFSAAAAISASPALVAISILGSTLLMITALLIAAIGLVLGIRSMMEHGTNTETAPTLMNLVPLTTIMGIMLMRQGHGLGTQFAQHVTDADTFMLLARLVSLQLVFVLFGLLILSRHRYGKRFLWGRETSVMSYALVCPGAGFVILTQFLIHKGLVATQVVAMFSPVYWMLVGSVLAVQAATALLVLTLNHRHFGTPRAVAAVPAE